MKTRSGFVSNSSSCSFVIIGLKFQDIKDQITYDEDTDLYDYFEKNGEYDTTPGDIGFEDKNFIIGDLIQYSSDGDYPDDIFCSIKDLITEKVRRLLKQYNKKEEDLIVHFGTGMC